jgi:hypothetical protein
MIVELDQPASLHFEETAALAVAAKDLILT